MDNNNLNNDFEVRLATLAAMEGDMTQNYANIFEVDKAILKKIQEGGGGRGAQIDDTDISTGTVWSSNKTNIEIVNVSTKLIDKADKTSVYDKQYIDGSLNAIKGNISVIDSSISMINSSISKMESIIVEEGTVMTQDLWDKLNVLTGPDYSDRVFVKSSDNGGVFRVATYSGGTMIFYDYSDGTIKLKYNTNFPVSVGNNITFISILMPKVSDINSSLGLKANIADVYDKTQIDASLATKVYSVQISNIYSLTQSEYEAIVVKDPSTLYIINDVSI